MEGNQITMDTIVAQTYSYVIGVDTHAATHTYAIITADNQHVDAQTFPTTTAGMNRAIAWAARRTGGDMAALWVIEGIGSYGAGLARTVADTGYRVVEAARMSNRSRRGIGKSDPVDAARIAVAVLPLPEARLREPRLDEGNRAALQVLLTARDEIGRERTRAINALTALARTTDLGIDARRALNHQTIAEIAGWRARQRDDIAIATARAEAIRLAKRIFDCDGDLKTNDARIRDLVADSPAAGLVNYTGIGPVTAATTLVAWSHPGRIKSEAAYAAIAGASPIPASSGKTIRYRLNRGGDRKLNRALNVMAMVRMVHDPTTRDYAQRRRREDKSDREIRRVLKRYLARSIYRQLNAAAATPQSS
ncbi:IS110 family RNA-guided transposase [Spelaeicoccus albus]|nr:IS110 family transposase [Spelaeicoccus albus]